MARPTVRETKQLIEDLKDTAAAPRRLINDLKLGRADLPAPGRPLDEYTMKPLTTTQALEKVTGNLDQRCTRLERILATTNKQGLA